eukprot:scaffold210460_cov17-Tisochrysis_lutea.AAC.1
MGVWRVNGTTRLQDLAVRRLFLLFPIACLVVTSFVHTEQSGHEGYRQASWHFLLTGLYCGDVNLYNFIGPAQFYNVFKVSYCAATALHSARYCEQMLK